MIVEFMNLEWYKYPMVLTIEKPAWVAIYFLMAGLSAFSIGDSKPLLVRTIGRILYTPLYVMAAIFTPILNLLLVLIPIGAIFGNQNYIGVSFYAVAIIVIILFVNKIEQTRAQTL